MLSKNIENALNRQIAQEAFAAYYYLSMASWCEHKGLAGAAKFLYRQSAEEREHMLKIFKYVNETGGHALAPEIKKMPQEYKSIVDVFQLALKQEVGNTKSFNNLVEMCLSEKDHSTNNFLQWFVAEQHEEEMIFKTILDKIKIIGTEGKGIYMIDKEIGQMTEDKPGS